MSKELAAVVFEEVRQDLADLKGVHGGAPSLARALERICARVEQKGLREGLKGAQKRELAVELAVLALKLLPPAWTSWLPEPLLRWALGRMVDKVVAAFKRTGKWAS